MDEQKLVAKGPIFDFIKQQTEGINVSNTIKDELVEYLNSKLQEEIELICKWFIDIATLQGKRTIQDREWSFILGKISTNDD